MIINGTYKPLFALRNDLSRQSNNSIAFRYIHKQHIDYFFEYNQMLLKFAADKNDKLVKKYVMHDNEGKPIIERQEGDLVFYQFFNENAKEKFQAEYQEMLNTKCKIGL